MIPDYILANELGPLHFPLIDYDLMMFPQLDFIVLNRLI